MQFFCCSFLPLCTIPYKLCNKKAQKCCLISTETTTFATVLRSSEVPLHFRERVCLFHVYGGFVGFTVWMKVKRPSYVMTMNGASREIFTVLLISS